MNTQKKATYTVEAISGKTYTYKFEEGKSENDYGNGIYIGVERPSGDFTSLDCRYIGEYDFITICESYLKEYYGANLVSLRRVE